jgi:hypothetical protein
MIGLSANAEKRYDSGWFGFVGNPVYKHAARPKEIIMRETFSGPMITVAIAGAAVSAVIAVPATRTSAQAPAASATAPAASPKTPWGEPDLQGIWTDESDTPLQRAAKYATQEFFTEAQRAELDLQRAALSGKDRRSERGTELDVTGSYNDVFISRKHTGRARPGSLIRRMAGFRR